MFSSLFASQISIAYSLLLILTVAGYFTDKIPIQINITLHSMLIISIGSFKSLEEMLKQIKRVHVDKIRGKNEEIEQMGWSDAI